MGLQKRIEEKMPWEWDKAAKELRVKGELVKRLYRYIPKYYKGNKLRNNPELRRRAYFYINEMFKRDVLYVIDVSHTDINIWRKLSERITQIREECK